MKKRVAFFVVLILLLASCTSWLNPRSVAITSVSRSATPIVVTITALPKATNTVILVTIPTTATPTRTNTPQPAMLEENKVIAVEFPLSILSKKQIQEVADCKILELAENRYPDSIGTADLLESFTPESNCDWAVLALSYAVRNESESPSQLGLEAFKKAVSKNYGFALAPYVFEYYFGSVHLVKNPQFAEKEIAKVEINYTWSGLGEPSNVHHAVTIEKANIIPIISSSTDSIDSSISVDKILVQDLAKELNDLLPIDSEVQTLFCTDNFPEWFVALTFTDGTKINMKSNSNFLFVGGPWQTEIEGQRYLQYSQTFATKIVGFLEALGLPLGKPSGMYCPGGVIFENAFSNFLPPTSTPSPNFSSEAIYTFVAQTVNARLTQIASGTVTPKP